MKTWITWKHPATEPWIRTLTPSVISCLPFTAAMSTLWAGSGREASGRSHTHTTDCLKHQTHLCPMITFLFPKREKKTNLFKVVWVKCQHFCLRDESPFVRRPGFLKAPPVGSASKCLGRKEVTQLLSLTPKLNIPPKCPPGWGGLTPPPRAPGFL